MEHKLNNYNLTKQSNVTNPDPTPLLKISLEQNIGQTVKLDPIALIREVLRTFLLLS